MTQRDLPVFGATTAKVRKQLGRRGVLRGLLALGGAVTVPLPMLDILLNHNGNAFADGAALPRCYATWFFGNGILPGLWVPTSTGTDWALSSQLQPLAAVKDQLTVVTGLTHSFPDPPHPNGSAASMTGAPIKNKTAQLKSIDQIVADVIRATPDGAKLPFKSLQLGVTPATPNGSETTLKSISHTGPNATLPPEFDPAKAFKNIFAGVTSSGSTVDPKLAALTAIKGSVLDAVAADATELGQSLGVADRARLDNHLQGIRELENRIKGLNTSSTAACTVPGAPTVGKDTQSEAPAAVNTVMAQLGALALACDRTRVLAFTFSLPAAHVYYRKLASDMDDDFHDTICHTDAGTSSNQPRVHKGVLYAMTCFAEFLSNLKKVQVGAGSLLDNSLVYASSCTSWGKIHQKTDWPVLLAGKAGGQFSGNQHYRQNNGNLSQVLLTVANAMGANLKEIGLDVGHVTTELSGLRKTV
jgi:Protein of unknown function (DUF1552)